MTMLLKFRGALRVSYCVLTSTLLNEGSVAFENDKHMLKKKDIVYFQQFHGLPEQLIVLSSNAGT